MIKLENDQEQKDRGLLLLDSNQARTKLPRIVKEIDGVIYNTGDPQTRLFGQINVGTAEYIGESTREKLYTDLKQLWRTKDAHYFFCSIGGIEPIDSQTAHAAMNRDRGYWRFLTEAEKKEIEQDDERKKIRKR